LHFQFYEANPEIASAVQAVMQSKEVVLFFTSQLDKHSMQPSSKEDLLLFDKEEDELSDG
jgi:hypothetical protein